MPRPPEDGKPEQRRNGLNKEHEGRGDGEKKEKRRKARIGLTWQK